MVPDEAQKAHLPKLAALFIVVFDDIKGQTISWSRSVDGLVLNHLEFAALPSGLHLVAEDVFAFNHQSLPGLAAFRNHELSPVELEEANRVSGGRSRGRRMRSVGVVLADANSHGDGFALTETLQQLHDSLEAAEGGVKLIEDDKDVHGDFERLWKELKSERGILHASPLSTLDLGISAGQALRPLTYLPTLFAICGPSFMTLWKYSLSGQRILFYSPPPLEPASHAAWCTWAIGSPPQSASSRPRRYLGNVGLDHMDDLKKTDQGGWVATTSDAIYKTRPEMWDLLVNLTDINLPAVLTAESVILTSLTDPTSTSTPSPPPTLTASYLLPEGHGKRETRVLTYTFSDIPLYRSLAAVAASPDAPTSGGLSTAFWTTAYGVFGTLYGFCLGVCEFALGRAYTGNGALYLDFNPNEYQSLLSSDTDDQEQENDNPTSPALQIIHHLSHHTHHLHARLKLLIAQRGPRILTKAEMSSLGLSVWSSGDRAFVEALARGWDLD